MKTFEFQGVNVCGCDCHKEGEFLFEFSACCNLQGFSYIKKDGSIMDKELYQLLRMDFRSTMEARYNSYMKEI